MNTTWKNICVMQLDFQRSGISRTVACKLVTEGLTLKMQSTHEHDTTYFELYTFSSILTHWGRSHLNCLNAELNPICYLLALLAHHFLHVSRIRVKSLTLRLLMSYMYMERLFLMFLDHTRRRSTVGRTPLDEWSARPHESYRLCCVVVCDLETSRMGAPYIYMTLVT